MKDKFLREKGFLGYTSSLAIPLMLQSLLYVGVNAINNIMFGRFGEVVMSGFSQAAQVFHVFTILTYGFAGTCKVLVAQYWGKQDRDTIRSIVAYSMKMATLFGLVFSLMFLFVPQVPMRIFSADPEVITYGCQYLRTISITTILYALSNIMYNSFSGVERTSVYLWGNITCYSINLVVNYVLIFGAFGLPQMGIVGAGIGALVGRIAEFILLATLFFRSPEFQFKMSHFKLTVKGMLRRDYYGVFKPIMAHEVIYSIGISMGQIIMGQISTIAVSAYNICYVLSSIMNAANSGLAGACQTICGKIMGSGELDRAKKAARTMLVYSVVLGGILAALMLLTGNLFISLYNVSAETVGYAKALMPVMAMFVFFSGLEYVALVNIPRAGGDAATGFWTDVVTMWMIAIPLAWLAAMKWGLSPVMVILLLKIDMPLKASVGVIAVLRMKWVKNLTREADEPEKAEA